VAIKSGMSVFRGEDVVLPFSAGEDITGWTVGLIVSDSMADSSPTLSVAGVITVAVTGAIEVTLTKAQTTTLSLPVYAWELARTNVGAEAVLGYGTLTVLPRVGV
jgi:hypothetical protein